MRGAKSAHIASFFRNDDDQFLSAVPFILAGLENREKVLYVTDRNSREDVLDAVMKVRNVQDAVDRGHLTFMTSDQTYLKDGHFDPNRMLGLIKDSEERAVAEGYTRLRASGEMDWYGSKSPGVEKIMDYEASINHMFPGSSSNILCQYYEPDFDPAMLMDVIRVHPRVVVQGEMCHNPYYLPPDEFLACMRGSVPKGVYEKTTQEIIKRAHLAAIHRLEVRDSKISARKLSVLSDITFDALLSQVAVVDFYSDLARNSSADSITKSYMEEITKKCHLMRKLLESAKIYQRAGETGQQWYELAEIMDTLAAEASSEGLKVTHKVSGVRVMADASLERAVLSVLENLPEGKGEVKLGCRYSEDGLIITIERPGDGVPELVKERIFELGYNYGGSDGYGLFLAREMLRASQLSLREMGVPGKCTRFEVLVPKGKYAPEER
ncbi:MAG: MEDS domain-containing protein [Thermoplasmata archaeon]|jgi:hypothetical protein|nr:MEDS domain-containing protein [Thermoplasmata archaeon]